MYMYVPFYFFYMYHALHVDLDIELIITQPSKQVICKFLLKTKE